MGWYLAKTERKRINVQMSLAFPHNNKNHLFIYIATYKFRIRSTINTMTYMSGMTYLWMIYMSGMTYLWIERIDL